MIASFREPSTGPGLAFYKTTPGFRQVFLSVHAETKLLFLAAIQEE